ncbi:hypothetical protein E2C01_054692 [Portunus trituberculatus]|uniref:Uncharacterized protein n=1 Tax=Portunus trituberculatus TaxID=210409 RepID=A0A5B7GUM2_PORTR|nr:hypothetical protein [Portunus trituberculatus]
MYSTWIRKDRSTQSGGMTFCFKSSFSETMLETPFIRELEMVLLELVDEDGRGVLCVELTLPPTITGDSINTFPHG